MNSGNGYETKISNEDEEYLLAPFHYFMSKPEYEVRSKIMTTCNKWLRIDEEKLRQITEIINMLLNAYLMIDDMEDGSMMRNGNPTAQVVYGIPRALNCANHVYFIVLEKIQNLHHPDAVNYYIKAMLEMHRGQGKEIYWRNNMICPTVEEYEEMSIQKTGGVIALADNLLQLFSRLKIDSDKLVKLIALYIQIWNDYLNLTSEKVTKQKSFAEDLTEGKFSFPIIHAIRKGGMKEDDPILNILRQRPKDIETKKHCVKLIRERGSFEYTLQRLEQINQEAREEVESMGGTEHMHVIMTVFENAYAEFYELDSKIDSHITKLKLDSL